MPTCLKMVVFMDLEDDAEPPEQGGHWLPYRGIGDAGNLRYIGLNGRVANGVEERENPNKEKPITEALGCYPYLLLPQLYTSQY